MDQVLARDIMRYKTRPQALALIAKRAESDSVFDEEIEAAYEMAAEALEYTLEPAGVMDKSGNELFRKVPV